MPVFTCFPQETIPFFLQLAMNNSQSWFHEHHDEYIACVQTPFYDLIDTLAPFMRQIDPEMEVRPNKCLARIHRDTRFSKDKSPYRDHLWLLFRRAAEPREQCLMFWFEFGPREISWGLGFWGENRPVMDMLRRRMEARPDEWLRLLEKADLPARQLVLGGDDWKRLPVPGSLPVGLIPLYIKKTPYFSTHRGDISLGLKPGLIELLKEDYAALAPFYHAFRGMMDETLSEVSG